MLVVNYAVTFRTLHVPLKRFAADMWRQPLAAAGMYIVVDRLVSYLAPTSIPQVLQLAAAVALGAAAYVGLLLGLWILAGRPAGAERKVLKQVGPALRRLRRGP
jgi:PST family polysaccharide transporter